MKLRLLLALATLLVAVKIWLMPTLEKAARVPSGYKAKVACSEVYLAKRPYDTVVATDFDSISPAFDWVTLKNDSQNRSIEASFLFLGDTKAIYRPGIGCTLDVGNGLSSVKIPDGNQDLGPPYSVDIKPQVQSALLSLFDNTQSKFPIRTRGAVVVQNGQVIAEHYAQGFNADTRQQSWSMSKGVTQALVGILNREQLIKLEDTHLLPIWPEGDDRQNISMSNLLQMASGLEFDENYANPFSAVDQMLFNQSDMAIYAANRPLGREIGTSSIYSSGTTNIVSAIIRNKLEGAGRDYHSFPYSELFYPLGMSSAIFEVDAAGTFIGSSYIYATPRDFARFGQLYLQDGVWENRQILPKGWVDYTATPAPGSNGSYGAHWSLNIGSKSLPGLPEDVIYLGGNDGQMIIVIPSKNTVIVRLGLTRSPADVERDVHPLIRKIYETL